MQICSARSILSSADSTLLSRLSHKWVQGVKPSNNDTLDKTNSKRKLCVVWEVRLWMIHLKKPGVNARHTNSAEIGVFEDSPERNVTTSPQPPVPWHCIRSLPTNQKRRRRANSLYADDKQHSFVCHATAKTNTRARRYRHVDHVVFTVAYN